MAGIFDAVDRLQNAMTFHRERQSVLAGNLANIETPGYRSLDLAQVQAGDEGVLALQVNDSRQLQANGDAADGAQSRVFDDGGALVGPDGNAVSLDRELAKIDANRTRYTTAADLVSRRLALLKYAAGDGVG